MNAQEVSMRLEMMVRELEELKRTVEGAASTQRAAGRKSGNLSDLSPNRRAVPRSREEKLVEFREQVRLFRKLRSEGALSPTAENLFLASLRRRVDDLTASKPRGHGDRRYRAVMTPEAMAHIEMTSVERRGAL